MIANTHHMLHKIQEKRNLDDHQKQVLAKFGYKQYMKTKNKKNTNILLYIWLLTQTTYRNLAIVFSNSGN
jgi:hypothetical protein